uniref:Ubiquitin-like protein 7 n=1 Tax=Petromyzon marinus TaxID=7757 RepID=A0AAJ7UCH2_PETMA|nr:ubiquitin-like protein 7 [Petromyzon marinus]
MMEEEEEGAMETKGICVKVAERLSDGRIAFPDISVQHSALAAKEIIARKIHVAPVLIDLVFCGKRLQDGQSLESCGVQPGATVHVLRRAWPEPTACPEPVDKVEAQRALRFLHSAIASSLTHREAIFKTLNSKESLDQLVVATPGLSNDPIALGVLQDKDLFMLFADPSLLDKLIASHPALVNAMVLLLHSIVGSTPLTGSGASARQRTTSASYDIPGGFAFDGLSDDEEGEQSQSGALDQQMMGTSRPSSLRYAGSSGPRPITQTELATALALASTPGSSANTPTSGLQASTATSPGFGAAQPSTSAGAIRPEIFTHALQHALRANNLPSAQPTQWRAQLQQLRAMGIHDDGLSLRALQATGGDIQAALELIFAGMAP